MDFLWAILPYFNAGLMASVVSRFTGINMSMVVVIIMLYMGARPEETVVAMLIFNVYNFFTSYTQVHPMRLKEFALFPGFKIIIPLTISVGAIALEPFLGILLFVAVFLAEIFAATYRQMDKAERPSTSEVVKMIAVAAVLMSAAILVVPLLPERWYFILPGLVILAYAGLMWYAGDRRAMRKVWDMILYGASFVTGLTGIECSDWFDAMRRSQVSPLARSYTVVINSASLVALAAAYLVYHYFAIGSLFIPIGSAFGIRLFGVYVHDSRGKFAYVTLGLAVLAVLVFYLTQPVPVGLPEVPLIEGW